jgi:hypothetical protein
MKLIKLIYSFLIVAILCQTVFTSETATLTNTNTNTNSKTSSQMRMTNLKKLFNEYQTFNRKMESFKEGNYIIIYR